MGKGFWEMFCFWSGCTFHRGRHRVHMIALLCVCYALIKRWFLSVPIQKHPHALPITASTSMLFIKVRSLAKWFRILAQFSWPSRTAYSLIKVSKTEMAAEGTIWANWARVEQKRPGWPLTWPLSRGGWPLTEEVCKACQGISSIAISVLEMVTFVFFFFNLWKCNSLNFFYISWTGQLLFHFHFDNEM